MFSKTQEEHDRAQKQTFQAIRKAGLTLYKKCQFNQKTISFSAVVFGSEKFYQDLEKVNLNQRSKTHENSKGNCIFIGLTS